MDERASKEAAVPPLSGGDVTRITPVTTVRGRVIGTNVVALGFTSCFTDISSEMVAAVLPIWLVRELAFGTLEFGTIDGLWRSIAGILGAFLAMGSDRRRRHKLVAVTGYTISTLSRIALCLVSVAWLPVATSLFFDRLGKGMRTPSRDALISFASAPGSRATAFGVHRTLDALGRLAGPAIAFAILKLAPGAFDAVFFVSVCFALIGLATLTLLVVDDQGPARDAPRTGERLAAAWRTVWRHTEFRWLVVAVSLLGLATMGEAFFVLALERRGLILPETVPLLFTAIAGVQILFTLPCARLADRIGRKRVWVAGHGLLVIAYAALAFATETESLAWVAIVLLGAFLAATEGVVAAVTSLVVSERERAAGLSVVACAVGAAKLVASIAFGALWAARGLEFSVGAFAACVTLGVCVAWFSPWSDRGAAHA